MNIADTNTISHILENDIVLADDYYLPPDVVEESEMTQVVVGKRLPRHLHAVAETNDFDEALYLAHYKRMLNKYGGRSFYNMKGFGDISILATLHMFRDVFERQSREQLFSAHQPITVFTGDRKLTTKINKELPGPDVTVSTPEKVR